MLFHSATVRIGDWFLTPTMFSKEVFMTIYKIISGTAMTIFEEEIEQSKSININS